jgi:hypothetical protein
MAMRCVGLVVSASDVTVVDTVIPDDAAAPVTLVMDDTWKLATGDRSQAYNILHQRCSAYLRDNKVNQVVIKSSALPQAGVKLALLEGAELRGVIMGAAASVCSTKSVNKSQISRSYGKKVDDCIQDDSFWDEKVEGGKLRKGSREAAMLVVSHRGKA